MTDTPQGRAFGAAAEEKYRKRSYMRRQDSDDSDLSTPVGPPPLSSLDAPPSMGEKRKIGMCIHNQRALKHVIIYLCQLPRMTSWIR